MLFAYSGNVMQHASLSCVTSQIALLLRLLLEPWPGPTCCLPVGQSALSALFQNYSSITANNKAGYRRPLVSCVLYFGSPLVRDNTV